MTAHVMRSFALDVAVLEGMGGGCVFDAVLICCLQMAVPHSEDWARFARTLVEIRANHGDGEEEGPGELST